MSRKKSLSIAFNQAKPTPTDESMIYSFHGVNWPGPTQFIAIDGNEANAIGASQSIAIGTATVVPVAGTLRHLYFNGGSDVATANYTITIVKNGVATALTITIPTGQTIGSDNTHSVVVAAGDLLSYTIAGNDDFENVVAAVSFTP